MRRAVTRLPLPRPPFTRRRGVARAALVALLALAAGGCSLGLDRRVSDTLTRTLDQTQAHYRSGAGRDSLLATTDSLAGYLARAITANALPVLDSAEARLLTRLQHAIHETRDTITGALTVHWSPAVTELIDRSIAQAGGRGQEELAALLVRLQLEAQRSLMPTIDEAVSRATVSALDQLALRIGPEFRAGLIVLADSVARVGARAAVGQTTPIWKNLRWLLVIATALGFAGLAFWALLRRRRLAAEHEKSMQSLAVLAAAIKEREAAPIAADVKRRAIDRGVEPWLNDFLRQQGTLVAEPPPAPAPAEIPPVFSA